MADVKKIIQLEFDTETGQLKILDKELDNIPKKTKKAADGFKGIGLAIKAAGIGLLLGVIAKLTDLFSQNQKVVDTFSTAMNGLSIAFNDFFSFVSDNIGTVTKYFQDLFDNPGRKLREIADTIKNYVITNVQLLIKGFGTLGEAMAYLFDGEFEKALGSAKDGALEIGEALLKLNPATAIVANLAEAVYDNRDAIADYTKSLWRNSEALVNNQKQLARLEIESRRLQILNERDAEIQRQIRDDVTKTFDERIEANEKIGKILEAGMKMEQDVVNQRIAILQNEQKVLGYNEERQLQILSLQTDILDIENRITGVMSEQKTNLNSLQAERAAAAEQNAAELHELVLGLEAQTAAEDLARDARLAKEQKDRDDRIALEKSVQDAKVQMASDAFGALSALTSAFAGSSEKAQKKAFGLNKALGIAQATIQTYQAATAAYASQLTIPSPDAPVRAAIAAGTAIAFGLAQVAQIARQKFQGSGGGGGGAVGGGGRGGGMGSPNAPQFNTVGASGTNQLAESIAAQNAKPIKAFVVSGEVSSAQSADRNRVQQASYP